MSNCSAVAKLKQSALWLFAGLILVFIAISLWLPCDALPFDVEPVWDFSTGWELLDEQGVPVQAATSPATATGLGTIRLAKTTPAGMPDPSVLGFRSAHQFVRLYCGDELLYSYGYGASPAFGKSPGAAWNLVRLPHHIEGAQLVLELSSPYPAYQRSPRAILLGSRSALLFSLLRSYSFSFLLTVLVFGAGVITLLTYYLVMRKDSSAGKEMLYLGLFALFVSIWMLGETQLTQFLYIAPTVNVSITFIAMLLTPIPLFKYIACNRSTHCRLMLERLVFVIYLLCAGCILLQMFNIMDFIEQVSFIHLMFFAIGIVMLCTLVADRFRHPSPELTRLMLSLGVLMVCFVLEVIYLYIGHLMIGDRMRIGVLLFIAIQAQAAFKKAGQILRMSKLASVDALTGCLNRTAYIQHLMELDAGSGIGIVIADLNDLKLINDTHGHTTGDDAIIRCARCFSEAFSLYGACFRIGGDEFAMLGDNLTLEALRAAGAAFEKLHDKEHAAAPYHFMVSYGYTLYNPKRDQTLTDAVRRADRVMYRNKRLLKQQEEAARVL